ncbi:MAG: two-component sensor histidine kinase [uncultured bacterium]|nr:MAG: two-component sensor histidine kinase [uncultured bacterium]
MIYIILLAVALNFYIGILTIRNDKKTRDLILFSILCFMTSLWALANFLLYFYGKIVFLNLAYGFGAIVTGTLLLWTYEYDHVGKKLWKSVAILVAGFSVVSVSIFTDLVIGNVQAISSSGIVGEKGLLLDVYGVYLLATVLLSLSRIIFSYRRRSGEERKQTLLVLIGVGGFTGFSLLVSAILPMFGILKFTNLDSPTSLIFAIFTSIAITKHHFLGIKIFVTHILVAVLIVASLVEVFYSNSMQELFFRIIFFIVVFIAGILLSESVLREASRKAELESTNIKLLHANSELEKLDEAKTEFISIASHQLRTPLTTSKGFLSLVFEGNYGKIPKKLVDPLARVQKSNMRLLHLIEDLLNISRIESGRMVFEFQKEKVEDLLEELVESFELLVKEKGLNFSLKLPRRKLPLILIDRGKIREAISNLIDNSIKYTEKGGVSVSAELIGDVIRIVVSDTGIGIAKEDLENIFGKFSRGSNQKRLTSTGTGLGLYFGKKVVEANRGKMWVESEGDKKGSSFIIEIPVEHVN